MTDEPQPGAITPPEEHPDERTMPHCIRSEELLRGGREVLIAHGQEIYRLRLTRSGKLILGK